MLCPKTSILRGKQLLHHHGGHHGPPADHPHEYPGKKTQPHMHSCVYACSEPGVFVFPKSPELCPASTRQDLGPLPPPRKITPQGTWGLSGTSRPSLPWFSLVSFPDAGHHSNLAHNLHGKTVTTPSDACWTSGCSTHSASGRDYNTHSAPGHGTTLFPVFQEAELKYP